MRILSALALGCLIPIAQAAGPNILSNTDHIVSSVTSALTILGSSNTVNQTCPTGSTPGTDCLTTGGPGFEYPPTIISNAGNSGVAEYLAGSATSTGTPNTNVPYTVINQSSTQYSITQDQLNYAALNSLGAIYEWAYCGGPGAGDAYPPIAMSTIVPNNVGGPLSSQTCGYAVGLEFSMTAGYMGFDTGSPSGTTESMSAVLATMKDNHSTWTWGDIKGALRQTASCWALGYAATCTVSSVLGFGFGNVNYTAATAISSTSGIYLQGPGISVNQVGHRNYAMITLYPFRTTRRSVEKVFIGGTWPAASSINEMTAAQVTAAGGTLVYTSNGTDVEPTFAYAPGTSGTATFYALSCDSSGNCSRVESYTGTAVTFVVGTACLQ